MEEVGLQATEKVIADFSTRRVSENTSLNPDIEIFLKKNAIQFAREKKSVTNLVCDEGDGSLLGYFTIAHKAMKYQNYGLSNTTIRKIERYARLQKEIGAYIVSVFLIAQFGKNYSVDDPCSLWLSSSCHCKPDPQDRMPLQIIINVDYSQPSHQYPDQLRKKMHRRAL